MISETGHWQPWLRSQIPDNIDSDIRRVALSHLKHLMCGLEMKKALIVPHAKRGKGKSVLFESYFHTLNFEFNLGAFSVLECLGSLLYLSDNGLDGTGNNRIRSDEIIDSLVGHYDPEGLRNLQVDLEIIRTNRNKLHQDRLVMRELIDWHSFGYESCFLPAQNTLNSIFLNNESLIPNTTNLIINLPEERADS